MLQITIPDREYWDAKNERFVIKKGQTISLEHSLVSLSKWEAKFHKPFLTSEKNGEEILYYIQCMTVTQNVNPDIYEMLTRENFKEINDYIADPMTATTITIHSHKSPGRECITSELIYYWMIAHGIPFKCEKWHLNRLLMLIKICNIKNQPDKKMSKAQTMRDNKALNEMRRAKLHSKG